MYDSYVFKSNIDFKLCLYFIFYKLTFYVLYLGVCVCLCVNFFLNLSMGFQKSYFGLTQVEISYHTHASILPMVL